MLVVSYDFNGVQKFNEDFSCWRTFSQTYSILGNDNLISKTYVENKKFGFMVHISVKPIFLNRRIAIEELDIWYYGLYINSS